MSRSASNAVGVTSALLEFWLERLAHNYAAPYLWWICSQQRIPTRPRSSPPTFDKQQCQNCEMFSAEIRRKIIFTAKTFFFEVLFSTVVILPQAPYSTMRLWRALHASFLPFAAATWVRYDFYSEPHPAPESCTACNGVVQGWEYRCEARIGPCGARCCRRATAAATYAHSNSKLEPIFLTLFLTFFLLSVVSFLIFF